MENTREYHSISLKFEDWKLRISKHNFDSIVMKYIQIVKPSLYYTVLNDHPFERENKSFNAYWIDSRSDPISRGKVLEVLS